MVMSVIFCMSLIVICLVGIISGEGATIKDAPVPVWCCWCVLFVSFLGLFLCFNKEKKKRNRPDAVIDAEYAKAKESMDEWHFLEYGEWPDHEEGKEYADNWYIRSYGKKSGEATREDLRKKDE